MYLLIEYDKEVLLPWYSRNGQHQRAEKQEEIHPYYKRRRRSSCTQRITCPRDQQSYYIYINACKIHANIPGNNIINNTTFNNLGHCHSYRLKIHSAIKFALVVLP